MTLDEVRTMRARLSTRLNNYLIEMQEGYDDSVVGFNECQDVVIKFFDCVEAEIAKVSPHAH